MGQNFALNMAEHGFKVCVGNRSPAKVDLTVKRAADEGNLPIFGAKDPEDLIGRLSTPRKVIILVQAGKPVDGMCLCVSLSKSIDPVVVVDKKVFAHFDN